MAIQASNQAAKSDWHKTHQSPFYFNGKTNHMIEVWENSVTKKRYYFPMYSRTGRTWANYMSGGQRLSFLTYAGAANHIKSNSKPIK